MSEHATGGHGPGERRKPGLRPHPTDVVSLVFGLIFLGLAGWWLLRLVSGLALPLGWLLAGTLIVVGAIGLVAAVRPDHQDREGPPPGS